MAFLTVGGPALRLQDALQAVDDISLDLLPAELDLDDGLGPPDNEQHKQGKPVLLLHRGFDPVLKRLQWS